MYQGSGAFGSDGRVAKAGQCILFSKEAGAVQWVAGADGLGFLLLAGVRQRVENKLAQTSASWRSGGSCQRHITPQAAPQAPASLGQSAAWAALAG